MKYFHDQVFNDSMFLCMYYCLTLYDHPFCFFHASLYKVISSWSKVHALEGKNWLHSILTSSLNFLQWNCTMLRNYCTKLSSIQESTIIINSLFVFHCTKLYHSFQMYYGSEGKRNETFPKHSFLSKQRTKMDQLASRWSLKIQVFLPKWKF